MRALLDLARNLCTVSAMLVFVAGSMTKAQNATSTYDPRVTFAPLSLPDSVNEYRSSNGAPGPAYWQNAASYELHAQLDPSAKELRATRRSLIRTTVRTHCPVSGFIWSRTSTARTRGLMSSLAACAAAAAEL